MPRGAPDSLEQLPPDTPVDIVGGDGAYDTRSCHAAIAAIGGQRSIPSREGATPSMEGGQRRSPPLAESLMSRLKTLTGHCLWARKIGSQTTEAAIRADVLKRIAALARPQSVRTALAPTLGGICNFIFDLCNNAVLMDSRQRALADTLNLVVESMRYHRANIVCRSSLYRRRGFPRFPGDLPCCCKPAIPRCSSSTCKAA